MSGSPPGHPLHLRAGDCLDHASRPIEEQYTPRISSLLALENICRSLRPVSANRF
jgi:hypothetical protein